MAEPFDTGNLAEALPHGPQAPGDSSAGAQQSNPRELGWAEPTSFDYDPAAAREPPSTSHNDDPGTSVWAHNFKRYEWNDEFGEVGPEIPELEQELFHNETVTRRGMKFEELLAVKVTAEAQEKPDPIRDFRTAGLHPCMEDNIAKCGYEIPTPIQAYTVPAVVQGFDVIATAQTGSGKTAAYLIPAISKLMGKVKKIAAPRPLVTEDGRYERVKAEPLILVVAPTRELCCQIFDEARRLCYRSMLRPCVVYGGAPIREQREQLSRGCDVLIATPGRLIDFMNDTNLLSFARIRVTVIDEADEMLSEDWDEEMTKILGGADNNQDGNRQYLFFSATFSKRMRKLAKKSLANNHVRIRIGRSGAVLNNVTQRIIYTQKNMKQQALYDLLMSQPPARTMIFVKSKKTADFVDDFLFNSGLPSTSIHSDRTQREREDAIRAFRKGKAPILVTTSVSGRGIDVRNVMHVVNFDLPTNEYDNGEDEYIHRIGRTARIGNEGLATSFYNEDDEGMAQFLVNTLVECKQEVPEFLSQFKPTDENNIDWNDDSEDEELENGAVNGTAGDAWGGENAAGPSTTDSGWGGSGNTGTVDAGWGTAANGDTATTNAGTQSWAITGASNNGW